MTFMTKTAVRYPLPAARSSNKQPFQIREVAIKTLPPTPLSSCTGIVQDPPHREVNARTDGYPCRMDSVQSLYGMTAKWATGTFCNAISPRAAKVCQCLFIIATLLVTGCNSRFQPDAVTEMAITPLTVKAEGLNQKQLNAFLSHNRTLLLTEPVTLTWTGDDGKNMAVLFSQQLRSLGADPVNLLVREAPNGVPGVTVSYVTHRVQTPGCLPYDSINMFDMYRQPRQEGCFVDSNRWQSLVHPERAYGGSTTVTRQP